MFYKTIALALISFFLSTQLISANSDVLSAYRSYQDISVPKINVPTVVELPLPSLSFERFDFLVFDKTSQSFEPSLVVGYQLEGVKAVAAQVSGSVNGLNSSYLIDNNDSTSIELPVINDERGSSRITVIFNDDLTTDSLSLLLDNYVALPNTVSLSVETTQGNKIVLATKEAGSQLINFPKTTAKKFFIDLTYSQPLRITDVRFNNLLSETPNYSLRFLAQPSHDYSVYFDPDRRVKAVVGEMTNLSDNRDVLNLSKSITQKNADYKITDTDGDNIPDVSDNCVSISNFDQQDINQNGRGDVCDDFDKDGVINSLDNCPNQPNLNQSDNDGDRIGDVCDDEESRLTEKYKWLPWLGIIAATLLVIGLFVMTALSMRKKEEIPPQN